MIQKKNEEKYYKCKFYLDEKTWRNTEIFAVFKGDDGFLNIIPLGKYNNVLSCTLPKKIISSQIFKIYLYSNTDLKTNAISVSLSQACNANRRAKNENAINQLISKINTKIDNIVYIDNQLQCYSNNTLIDTIYIDNVDEDIVKREIQIYLSQMNPKIDDIKFINNIITCYADNKIICEIPFQLSNIAWSGDYNDLENIPNEFNPSQHTHQMIDVTDYDDNVSMDLGIMLDFLSDEINKE